MTVMKPLPKLRPKANAVKANAVKVNAAKASAAKTVWIGS